MAIALIIAYLVSRRLVSWHRVLGFLPMLPSAILADYQSYIECQEKVGKAYQDRDNWTRMSILNVAHMGKFSSDRSIAEYCEDIWRALAVPHISQVDDHFNEFSGL